MEYNTSKFEKGLSDLGIELTEKQKGQFITYYEMLIEKNKVMNLTTITEFDEVIEKHFLDSLEILKFVQFTEKTKIIDIGTGAGFPGIPLKIVCPQAEFVLLDSLNKRVKFLDEVAAELGLDRITMLHGRAEDYGKNSEYREKFDYCVSRAVANLSSLSEYCLPFVKIGGKFIPYKSGTIDEELNKAKFAINLLGGKVEKVEKFNLSDAQRSLLFINKIKATAKKYPRKPGLPGKEPL